MDISFDEKYQNALYGNNLTEAENLIRDALKEEPYNVWCLAQLSSIFYYHEKYQDAFEYSSKALALDHMEPLTLWIHANNLEILGFENQAFNIWEYLVRRSAKKIGLEDCGEGIEWAKSLQKDCLYRMAKMAFRLEEYEEAAEYIRMLKYGGRRKIKSIYSWAEILELDDFIADAMKS